MVLSDIFRSTERIQSDCNVQFASSSSGANACGQSRSEAAQGYRVFLGLGIALGVTAAWFYHRRG